MRQTILFLALVLAPICHAQVVIGGAPPGPTVNTCWSTNDQASSSTTISVTVSPVGGSGHILIGFVRAGTGQPFTFSDNSGSNTWLAVSLSNNGAVASWGEGYVQNPAGGTYTVTGTLASTGGSRSITVCELTGLISSSSLDSGSVISGTCANGTSCTTTTFSTVQAHEFIIVMGTVNSLSDVFTAGLIGGTSSNLVSVVANDSFGEYLNVTTIQTNITAAISGTGSVNWGYVVAAFKTP